VRILELDENVIYIDDESFKCQLDDDKDIYLGLICEAIDMRELDEKYDNDPYPVVMETEIVVSPRSLNSDYLRSANEYENMSLDSDEMKIYVSYRYCGGVPVNMESIKGSMTCDVDSEVRTRNHGLYGEIKIRYFRSVADALRYAKTVYKHNAQALFGLVGFYLDRAVNLLGVTGWDIINLQANNIDYM